MIPYGRQDITKDDIESVVEVLKSDFLTQGPVVPKFEKSIKDYCKVNFAFALNSATSALHIACLAIGVKKDDIVWTSANTFVASANCALYCGASVDFIDINPFTNNVCVKDLENKLKKAKISGALPKVVIPVHLTGQSCQMKEIYNLSVEYGFKIIEDASHAIGAKYKNEPVGCCTYSDICVFSFHPVKIITTGEGGVATTNNEELAFKINILRSHGITRDPLEMNESHGPWYYEQLDLGFNYRMTEIHAALGISQMNRLDEIVLKRHEIANIYNENLSDLPIRIPTIIKEAFSSIHLYVIKLNLDELTHSHHRVFTKLRSLGILVNLHYIPVYLHPFYQKLGFTKGYCPESEKYYSEAISIPMYPSLTSSEQETVIDSLKEILR